MTGERRGADADAVRSGRVPCVLHVPRVVLAELGGPQDAAVALARALRDDGAEVVYTGVLSDPGAVAAIVEQEDPDLLGLTIAPGAGNALADAVAAAVPAVRVAILDAGSLSAIATLIADADGTGRVKRAAICATDTSSAGYR
ncbi:hypothetical protein [Qaidamihabitans albus]|uniref:hypothetical protein n=1 Tax=Qaidamihabitans albus TaxID=2795733 RepID=UPI0018F1F932|nr:hypothetical protein [Qaidamihabitans albus]